jgi:hypothetical protein
MVEVKSPLSCVGINRTNLVNDAEQTFAPSLTRPVGAEVELVVGNPGAAEDQLTLTVLQPDKKRRW